MLTEENKNEKVDELQPDNEFVRRRNDVRFSSTFEEADNENYKWLASLSPEQHLQNATRNIKRIFAEDLKKNPHIGSSLSID